MIEVCRHLLVYSRAGGGRGASPFISGHVCDLTTGPGEAFCVSRLFFKGGALELF